MRVLVPGDIADWSVYADLLAAAVDTWPSELERADMRSQPPSARCLRAHPEDEGVTFRFHTDRNPEGYRLAWVHRSFLPGVAEPVPFRAPLADAS